MARFPIPRIREWGKQRLAEFVQSVESAGLVVRRDGGGEPAAVEEHRPDATGVIRAKLGVKGEATFRDLSAVAHGDQHGFTSRVERIGQLEGVDGVSIVAPVARLSEISVPIFLAYQGYGSAVGRRLALFGWNATEWTAWETEAGRALLAVVRSQESSAGK
jgi:hypothetical protein